MRPPFKLRFKQQFRRQLTLFVLLSAPLGAQTHLVIVSGLGGQPKYTTQFAELSTALADAAHLRAGLPDSTISWFGEPTAARSRWYRGASTRANVEAALQRLAARGTDEQLVLVLIGHGAGEGADTRIGLPGADLTAADFDRLLAAFGTRRVALVTMASGSGDMLRVLASPARVILSATKSAFERNETQFARFFVDAFAKDGADTDKDQRVSLAEAFTYADAEVKRFYENAGRLASEHPQMADEGRLAAGFFLSAGAAARAGGDPRLAVLYARKDSLDAQVRQLRARKEHMEAEAYDRELERLLVALAETSAEIRRLEKDS